MCNICNEEVKRKNKKERDLAREEQEMLEYEDCVFKNK